MNCEQFSSMLIGPVFGRPAAEQLMAARLHLSSCRHCGVDWEIHSRLVAMPVPAMTSSLEGRCRAAVARAGGGWDGKPRPGRQIILGTVLVVAAAAAAMVGLQRKEPQERFAVPIADGVIIGQPQEPAAGAGTVAGIAQGAAQVVGVDKDKHEDIARALYPRGFTVTIFPVVHEVTDAVGRSFVEKHYQALIAQLRAVPLLKLDIAGRSRDPAAGNADFTITLRSRESTAGPAPRKDARSWTVIMRVDGPRPGGAMGLSTMTTPVCGYQEEGDGYCTDAIATATRAVDALRENVFFPRERRSVDDLIAENEAWLAASEAARVQRGPEWAAVLANRAASIQDRVSALNVLVSYASKSGWDDATVRAALDLAAEARDDAELVEVWRRIRGCTHPDVLQPALDILNSNAAQDVRVAAATVLVEGFGADPAALPTLERLAADPAAGLVGQLAARNIHGDVVWRDFVLDTLQDAGRPALDRFEPIAYMLEYATPTEVRLFLEDEGILAALSQLLPRLWTQQGVQVVGLVEQLGEVRQPAAADIILRIARETKYKATAIDALARQPIRHARVRDELEKIAASDPEPGIREMARRALAGASAYADKAR